MRSWRYWGIGDLLGALRGLGLLRWGLGGYGSLTLGGLRALGLGALKVGTLEAWPLGGSCGPWGLWAGGLLKLLCWGSLGGGLDLETWGVVALLHACCRVAGAGGPRLWLLCDVGGLLGDLGPWGVWGAFGLVTLSSWACGLGGPLDLETGGFWALGGH